MKHGEKPAIGSGQAESRCAKSNLLKIILRTTKREAQNMNWSEGIAFFALIFAYLFAQAKK